MIENDFADAKLPSNYDVNSNNNNMNTAVTKSSINIKKQRHSTYDAASYSSKPGKLFSLNLVRSLA